VISPEAPMVPPTWRVYEVGAVPIPTEPYRYRFCDAEPCVKLIY
jgi:hypothetical protein